MLVEMSKTLEKPNDDNENLWTVHLSASIKADREVDGKLLTTTYGQRRQFDNEKEAKRYLNKKVYDFRHNG